MDTYLAKRLSQDISLAHHVKIFDNLEISQTPPTNTIAIMTSHRVIMVENGLLCPQFGHVSARGDTNFEQSGHFICESYKAIFVLSKCFFVQAWACRAPLKERMTIISYQVEFVWAGIDLKIQDKKLVWSSAAHIAAAHLVSGR